MKKFYSLLVAAAMVMGATSCQKDVAETVATNEPVSFTATLNNTRTELGEGNKVMWNADDKITIYTQENKTGVVFDGDATEATATATFTTSSEFTPSATGYFAVHPNTTNVASYADCVWSVPVSISDTQYPNANTYDEASNFTVAYSTTNNLSFKPGTALLKFTYTGTHGYAYLHSYSATLYGSATLNYSTNDNTISYTNISGSGSLYIENLTQGETYYVAIFPGTATDLALYDGSMYSYDMMSGSMSENIPIFKYSKEIEFEAGKVYTLNTKEPAVASPYKLISANMEQQFPMVIENGYHIAKGISNLDAGFCFLNGENALTATTDVVPGEWQATKNGWTEDYALIPFFTNCDQADIYLSEDASMMCVVPAGEPAPSQYHIYVYNSSKWDNVNIYACDADWNAFNGEWPGLAMSKTMVGEVEYYVYDIPNEYIGQQINFIFNSGTGDQTADLSATVNGDLFYFTTGDVVEDPANPIIPEAKKLYLVPNSNWKQDNARFAAYFFGAGEKWVNMTDEDKDGIYECEIPGSYPNVIFCRMNPGTTDNNWDNKWNQTADLTVPTDGTNCYTVTEGTWDKGGGTWSTK